MENGSMRRLRMKADGRIVELTTAGVEAPLAPLIAGEEVGRGRSHRGDLAGGKSARSKSGGAVRDLRARARLTQTEFAARLGVPVDTIRNWEQGKRDPRGPARALLRVIAHAPDIAFAALAASAD
jgi:putative transcriptional regulator